MLGRLEGASKSSSTRLSCRCQTSACNRWVSWVCDGRFDISKDTGWGWSVLLGIQRSKSGQFGVGVGICGTHRVDWWGSDIVIFWDDRRVGHVCWWETVITENLVCWCRRRGRDIFILGESFCLDKMSLKLVVEMEIHLPIHLYSRGKTTNELLHNLLFTQGWDVFVTCLLLRSGQRLLYWLRYIKEFC